MMMPVNISLPYVQQMLTVALGMALYLCFCVNVYNHYYKLLIY